MFAYDGRKLGVKVSALILLALITSVGVTSAFRVQAAVAQTVTYPVTQMSDTTGTGLFGVSAPSPSQTEYASASSQLVGKSIDQITIKLRKVGAPPGNFQVGIINADLSIKKLFGTMSASSLSPTATDYTFSLSGGGLYTIQAGDRIGIEYSSGDAQNFVAILVDRNVADHFDGSNTYRQAYTTTWTSFTSDDLYMILVQTHAADTTPPTVTASPPGGTFTTAQSVTLTPSESATIYYTTNGINPTTSSSVYSSPISISSNTTLKFFGVDTSGNVGTVVTQQYNFHISSCSVSISPSGSLMKNVGEFAQFSATATGTSSPSYHWTVSGSIIKDYQELTNFAAFTSTGNYTGLATTPMSTSDYNSQSIGFYWLPDPSQVYPNNANVTRTVSVSVNGGLCSTSQTVTLIRSTNDPNRQPEDYYARLNHPLTYNVPIAGQQILYNGTRLLQEHMLWHETNRFGSSSGTGPQSYDGSLFFSFHRALLDNYNAWRTMFGYPQVGTWTPGGRVSSIPTTENGQDITDAQRFGTSGTPAVPSYFTISGGTTLRPSLNQCDRNMPAGQQKLSDFGNLTQLGCAVTINLHNPVHNSIGSSAVQGACTNSSIFTTQCGDMTLMMTSEKDPIFWRFHNFLDQIRQNYLIATGGAAHILYQSPFPLYHYLTNLPTTNVQLENGTKADVPAMAVKFDQPVYGVRASDFTVNGSPATSVTGSGAGPYIFTGFDYPGFGDVNVAMSSGLIINGFDEPFAGDSWSFKMVDPNGNINHDGIPDGIKVNVFFLNPEVTDTDGDGIPDSVEIQSHCLNPLDSHDADQASGLNGYTYLQEFRLLGIITCNTASSTQSVQTPAIVPTQTEQTAAVPDLTN